MSNFKNFEKAKTLLRTRDGLSSFFEKWNEAISKPNVDKYGNGFCKDDRFAVFSTRVTFDCHTGNYGSSSCYTFKNGVDPKTCEDLFKKAIEIKKHEIFELMSELANDEAQNIKKDCQAELEEAAKKLEEISAA